jgi:hypothetical protein
MRFPIVALALVICGLALTAAVVGSSGTGVKVYSQNESSVSAETLPFLYNGSFIVFNDGLRESVYVVRVAVDEPAAITWVNVTPPGFVLSPGEFRMVNFSLNVSPELSTPGTYHFIFMPTMLPLSVEPYMDDFANYVSMTDRFEFSVDLPEGAFISAIGYVPEKVPVSFNVSPDRVNLVQYTTPPAGNRIVTPIDRAVRLNVPDIAPIDEAVPVSLSVFQGLSDRGFEMMAISPEGDFYWVENNNFTFDRHGRWGVVLMAGEEALLGRPVHAEYSTARLVIPGLDTILASISLLLLLSVVPIWLTARPLPSTDPYEAVVYKANVVKKYLDQFDAVRLQRATAMLVDEYDSLVAQGVRGDREHALSSLADLRTLAGLEPE